MTIWWVSEVLTRSLHECLRGHIRATFQQVWGGENGDVRSVTWFGVDVNQENEFIIHAKLLLGVFWNASQVGSSAFKSVILIWIRPLPGTW